MSFELYKRSLGILRITAAADSWPKIWYSNLLINPREAALDRESVIETFSAKLLATERAKSVLPSCHNARAYICRPLVLSKPTKVDKSFHLC